MERNRTSSYEYSSAFPFERDFDQWHYKRWTEDNWVGSNSKQDSDILLTCGRTPEFIYICETVADVPES